MTKRSPHFKRVARDLYDTPLRAVLPLSRHLPDVTAYAEPCVGRGALVRHLEGLGYHCGLACDYDPPKGLPARDAMTLTATDLAACSHIITNPPWPRARGAKGEPTIGLIRHLSGLKPTWLLLAADFAHNDYAIECLSYCAKIVSVGRVKWIPGSKHIGLDNAAWYLFDRAHKGPTIFHPGSKRVTFAGDIEALLG